MNDALHIIGTSFKRTELEQVAKVQWAQPDDISAFLTEVRANLAIDEIFFLQTCNRREFVIYAPNRFDFDDDAFCEAFLAAAATSMGRRLSRGDFYHYRDAAAVKHLFRVAGSLDSMVLGETEITKQIKDQARFAKKHGHLGSRLNILIDMALRVSKQVRHQTNITKNVVSMGSLAHRKARDYVAKKPGKRVVFVGAGHFITSILPTFVKSKDFELVFVNRTLPTELAETYGGSAVALSDFLDAPQPFDVMITATGAPHALFRKTWFAEHNPNALVLDAALPRDVEEAAGELAGVTYFDLAQMEEILAANRAARQAEIPKAEPLFDEGLMKVNQSWLDLDLANYNKAISNHFRETGQRALQHLLKDKQNQLGDELTAELQATIDILVKKLTNIPILGLKGVAKELGPEAVDAYTRQIAEKSQLFKSQVS